MYAFAHLVSALVVACLLRLPVVPAMVGGELPDLDVFLPDLHRGPIHTPVGAAVTAVVVYLVTDDRRTAAATGTGFLVHLFVDTFTYSGIMWLYPIEHAVTLGLVEAASSSGNLLLSGYCLLVFWAYRWQPRLRRWYRSARS